MGSDNRPIVFVDFHGARRIGRVVKVNNHTVWVKIMLGAKSCVFIKRHGVKHGIKVALI